MALRLRLGPSTTATEASARTAGAPVVSASITTASRGASRLPAASPARPETSRSFPGGVGDFPQLPGWDSRLPATSRARLETSRSFPGAAGLRGHEHLPTGSNALSTQCTRSNGHPALSATDPTGTASCVVPCAREPRRHPSPWASLSAPHPGLASPRSARRVSRSLNP